MVKVLRYSLVLAGCAALGCGPVVPSTEVDGGSSTSAWNALGCFPVAPSPNQPCDVPFIPPAGFDSLVAASGTSLTSASGPRPGQLPLRFAWTLDPAGESSV